MKTPVKIAALCLVMGVVGFGLGAGMEGSPSSAYASTLPTSALLIQSHTYADGSVVNSVVGDLVHADTPVQTWIVYLWSTPPGGAEALSVGAEADRADGETAGVKAAISLSEFASGTLIRGQFVTKDSSGVVLYTQDLNLVVP